MTKNQNTQDAICALIALSCEQYSGALYVAGVEFLKAYTGLKDNDAILNQLLATRAYWLWFMEQYQTIDQVFVAHYTPRKAHYDVHILRRLWKSKHGVSKMIGRPPLHLMHDSYSEMFEQAMTEDLFSSLNNSI